MQQLLPRSAMHGQYVYRPVRSLSGLGDDDSDSSAQTARTVSSAAGTAASIASTANNPNIPLSTKIESSIASGLFTAASLPTPAAPFLAIAGAAASLLASFGVGSGCGQSCVLATQYANQAESILKQNLQLYLAQSPRYYSAQQAALGVANSIFNDMRQQCSNPALGDAGRRCISERLDASACQWRDANGQCWNWIIGYYNPIANDPTVVPDPVDAAVSSAVGAASSALSSVASSLASSPLLWIGGAALLLAFVGGDD